MLTSSSKSVWGDKVRAQKLSAAFFERHTLEVARDLLGKVLLVRTAEGEASGRIVETEAYRADDPASHSSRGRTPRASIMFEDPGFVYVYFIYGMYEMLNFVTEPRGDAGAVLIRALEPLSGIELMRRRRSSKRRPLALHELASGPGKLCRALGVEMSHNGASLQGPVFSVWDDGWNGRSISVSPRVGITQGVDKPWRFFVTGSASVSRSPQNALARVVRPKGSGPR